MFSKFLLSLFPFLSTISPAFSQPVHLTAIASSFNSNPRPLMSQVAAFPEIPLERLYFEETLRIMSFNICCEDHPEYDWGDRKKKVASVIRFHKADLIGLQEASQDQIDDITRFLPEFHLYAGARLHNGSVDTHDSILFRKSRFDLLNSGFFFLSPTPDQPSKGWDAKYFRAAAWVKLFDKKSQTTFYFFNTHFDYHSRAARDQSARLLRSKVAEIARSLPFIVVGDFNLFPELGGGETYQILTDKNPFSEGRPLIDAQKCALLPHHGPTGTWSGFKEAGQPGIKPDYIFVDAAIEVYQHGILADSFDGQFPSDHLPVVADLSLR